VPLIGEPPILNLIFFFLFVPSLISPPEPASPSLPLPARARGRLLSVLRVVEEISVSLEGSTLSLTMEDLRGFEGCGRDEGSGAEEVRGTDAGDLGREPGGTGVDVPVGWEEEACFFLCFLREDSVPLASERLGEPGRLRELEDDFLRGSECLGRPEGVFVPLEEAPDGTSSPSLLFDLSLSDETFFSSSFFRSSSFSRSVSVSSDSL